jgi:hypothetical protein
MKPMSMRPRNRSWLDNLPYGLPPDFDYSIVKTASDAESLMCALPNRDRGKAAVGLYEHLHQIGRRPVYAGLMAAWDHDHPVVIEAFGGDYDFAGALQEVAPKVSVTRPVRAWRGIIVDGAHPREAVLGLSWTTQRDLACWFALRFYRSGLRPFVAEALFEPYSIITFWNKRREYEVIVDPEFLWDAEILIEGTSMIVSDLKQYDRPPDEAVARWQEASGRYAARERRHRARRLVRLTRGLATAPSLTPS